MKTFQTAIATSLHFLKLPIILLVLFFNFSIGESLPIPTDPPRNPIGGGLGGTVTRKFTCHELEIGRICGNETRKSKQNIGGNQIPHHTIFKSESLSLNNDLPIGGHGDTGTRGILDIGGNGASTMPRNILQHGSFATASIDLPIGNQDVPRQLKEIGGNQTAQRSNADIGGIGGGQVPPRTFIDAASLLTASNDLSIGGQGTPRHLTEIGGQEVPRHFIGTNPGQERRILAIGINQSTARSLAAFVGAQSISFTYIDIGGTQTAPRA